MVKGLQLLPLTIMTLIELIIYCAIVSMVMTGSVFSAYGILISEQKAHDGWQELYQRLTIYDEQQS